MINALAIAFDLALSQKFFGNTLMQLTLFFSTIGLSIIIGKTFFFIVKNHIKKIAETTRSKIDNILMEALDKPLWLIFFAAGFMIGVNFLSLSVSSLNTMHNIFWVIITIVCAWIITKLSDSLISEYLIPITIATGSRLDDQLIPVIRNVTKGIIVSITIVVILNNFGYDVTAILAGLGIGGLAIAFAAQQTIADVFGGISIFTSKPFVVGDIIEVEGIMGTVEGVGLRHTRVRDWDKRTVVFSNSKLSNAIIKNVSSEPEHRIVLNLGLTYNTPYKKLKQACEILKKIIVQHPGCAKEPIINFSEFKDFSLNILVMYFITDKGNWFQVRHEINMKIKEEFDKNKIPFAFPTQTVYLAK